MRTYPFARLGLLGLALASALTGCNTAPPRNGTTYDKIGAELKEATENRAVVTQRQDVLNSLLPPLAIDMPQAPAIEPGQRFDLSVVSAPAQQVLSAIVSGTRIRSSFMITTSAASMAMWVPAAPIAKPMSAWARAGASLMPSPAMAANP